MSEYSGRSALITGAGRNIGRAIALAFAQAGANVGIIVQTSRKEAESVAEEVRACGGRAVVAVGNVGKYADVERMVFEVTEKLGPIDYLVNNAANRPRQSFMEIAVEDWDRLISANLSSVFYLCRLVLPEMAKRKFGRIINIGGPDGSRGALNRAHNVACKAGVIGLTKAIALEFGQDGITANLVIPGAMDTTRSEKDYPNFREDFVARVEQMRNQSQISIPRLGTCEELAHAVMFFASEKSSYLTLQQLHVAGGLWGLP